MSKRNDCSNTMVSFMNYHLASDPKYRGEVIIDDIESGLKGTLRDTVKESNWEIIALEAMHYSQFQPVKPVSIDKKMKFLITTSDGMRMELPEFLRKPEKKLKRKQKQLSRKLKGSGKK